MKKLIPFALLSLSLAAGSHAAPFMAIGDGAELFLTGTLSIRADDNIFLTENAESDTILAGSVGAELTFGKDSQLKGALSISIGYTKYLDSGIGSRLNTNPFGLDYVTHYDDGKLKLSLNAGFHELSQNTVDFRPAASSVPALIRRDVYSLGANAEMQISQMTAVAAGVAYARDDNKRAGFTDSDSLTIPLALYYEMTPKIDTSVGYRYRDYQVDFGDDSTDHFFSIGARGDFSPKLTGTIAVGLNTRKLSGGGEDSQLGLDSSFAYEATPKTSLLVGASNDFGTSPQGQQQKNFTLRASLNTKLTEQWAVKGELSYRKIGYTSRTDDYYEANLGATYQLNANVTISGDYAHRSNDSALAGGDFKNNVFSLASRFRY